MAETVLFRLSVVLAVVTGTAGFVLGLLAWRRFRGAPFGTGLAVVTVFSAGFTVYHAVLFVAPELHATVEPLETAAFLLLVAFVWSMLRMHRRMSGRPQTEASR